MSAAEVASNVSNPLMGLEKTVGKEMLAKIQSCKLLVVGSGGIGCELLKDLALSGFRHVQVIDLDTIDVSNLNRQLLFRSQHVGMPKCTVACQVATDMVPVSSSTPADLLQPIHYQAHHGNVCDTSTFNVPFLEQFDLVLNALDNVEARRRVNRLCLAADTPLVEAGTTGYLGQTTVIHKSSEVACYECKTQETQKVYPICTIRSTPSMPVHTIVWAKELYKLIFHNKVEESMLYEDPEGEEPSTYMDSVFKLRELIKKEGGAPEDELTLVVGELLEKIHGTEIQKQLDMDRYKAAKKTPTVLDPLILKRGMSAKTEATVDTAIWTLEQCVVQFRDGLVQAAKTLALGGVVLEEFDKDDDLAMRLVCASSNLRSSIFGITPLQSLYNAKGIAGNIIPAIATTNAICAGLQILECFQILQQQLLLEEKGKDKKKDLRLKESCCYVNCLRNKTRNGLYLTASTLEAPNPSCFVCRNAIIPLALNVKEWTLERLLKTIVKGRLGFEAPTVLIDGDFVWEEGDGAEEEFLVNLPKTLDKLPCGGIQHGTVFELDDTTQNLTIQVSVTHREDWSDQDEDEREEFPFVVGGAPPKATKAAEAPVEDSKPAAMPAAAVEDDDDDDIVLIVDEGDSSSKKRSAEPEAKAPPAKKPKVDYAEIIEIE